MATDPVDQVRLLIADTNPADQVLTDAQILTFLDIEGHVVKCAAAAALEAIATSETLVSKKIRTQDLQTDGPAVAAELRARAAGLRQQASDDEQAELWDIVPMTDGRRPELTEDTEVWGL